MMDNQTEYLKVVQKHKESQIHCMEKRQSLMKYLAVIFKEIGKERTMQYVMQDFKDGRRASVRVIEQN